MDQYELLEARLLVLHDRLQWIADEEARAAWVRGYGAAGEFQEEREKNIAEAEEILERLDLLSKI